MLSLTLAGSVTRRNEVGGSDPSCQYASNGREHSGKGHAHTQQLEIKIKATETGSIGRTPGGILGERDLGGPKAHLWK